MGEAKPLGSGVAAVNEIDRPSDVPVNCSKTSKDMTVDLCVCGGGSHVGQHHSMITT